MIQNSFDEGEKAGGWKGEQWEGCLYFYNLIKTKEKAHPKAMERRIN